MDNTRNIKLLTPQQTSEALCVSPITLRKWRWEGKGPKFVKIGRNVAYRETDLSKYLDERTRRSTSDEGNTNSS